MIDKSANTIGVIEPEGKVISIQNQYNTKLIKSYVTVGDNVDKGQLLFELDAENDYSEVTELGYEIDILQTKKDRLNFQSTLNTSFLNEKRYPEKIFNEQLKILELEVNSFKTRKKGIMQEITVLDKEKNTSLARIKNSESQVNFLEEKEKIYKKLYEKGYEGRLSYLSISQELADSREKLEIAEEELEKVYAKNETLQTQLKQNELEFFRQTSLEFSEVSSQLESLKLKAELAEKRILNYYIEAPEGGQISKVNFRNSGDVISAGSVLSELIPIGRPLVFKIEIGPDDISDVEIGNEVLIYLSNIDTRVEKSLSGVITEIEPDASVREDETRFYDATVAFTETSDFILPGIDGTANILIGERTVIEYFLEPIFASLRGALTE